MVNGASRAIKNNLRNTPVPKSIRIRKGKVAEQNEREQRQVSVDRNRGERPD